jgi:hypothetical protein
MKKILMLMSAIAVASLFSGGAQAQEKLSGAIVPLKVQIVVSRYEGEKKVSSLPYTLAVNANDGAITQDGQFRPYNVARLRTGANVPIPNGAPSKESSIMSWTYKSIGTNIDCTAPRSESGRWRPSAAARRCTA